MKKEKSRVDAFTIIELLVVIAIIGILAAVTLVSYTGVSSRAVAATLQSDLSNAATQLKLFQIADVNDYYPATINCAIPDSSTNKCIKLSAGTTYTYTPTNTSSPRTFTLDAVNGTTTYRVTNSTPPAVVAAASLVCPSGFIVVPGSATYGTSDFCVMKYEAKQVGSTTTPISTASGLPWVDITQTTAIANAPNTKNQDGSTCTTCHLITDAEWMTIAQNVLSVPSNWSSGVVGTGYIYSGHNDSAPGDALEASADDSLGYTGTGNASGNQRRTLTLTNGEVIWDLSGNVWDWTAGTVQAPVVQPGITSAGYAWREWTAITNAGTLPINPSPTATGLSGANNWNSGYGVGQIFSSSGEVSLRGFIRGGSRYNGISAGVLFLFLNNRPVDKGTDIGFRVAAS